MNIDWQGFLVGLVVGAGSFVGLREILRFLGQTFQPEGTTAMDRWRLMASFFLKFVALGVGIVYVQRFQVGTSTGFISAIVLVYFVAIGWVHTRSVGCPPS